MIERFFIDEIKFNVNETIKSIKRFKSNQKGDILKITKMEPSLEIKCVDQECAACLIDEELCDKFDISQRDQIKEVYDKFLSR